MAIAIHFLLLGNKKRILCKITVTSIGNKNIWQPCNCDLIKKNIDKRLC